MTDDKISHEEMQQWFPEGVPMEIYNLIFSGDDALTIGEVRQQIRDFISHSQRIESLSSVIRTELVRQANASDFGPVIGTDDDDYEGWLNSRALARAILEGMPK